MVSVGNAIFSNTWKLFHDTISGNISDPSSRSKKWIFGTFPDIQNTTFPDYPIITITSPSYARDRSSFTTLNAYPATTTISVWTANQSLSEQLAGSILTMFTNRESAFRASGLSVMEMGESSFDTVIGGKNKTFKVDLPFSFNIAV